MSAPAPARPEKVKWAPSPVAFACQCRRRVRAGDQIFWLLGQPQMLCLPCARDVIQTVLEERELEELWRKSPSGATEREGNPMSNDNTFIPEGGGFAVYGASDEQVRVLRAREKFAKEYCAAKGWDFNNVTMPQMLEIRSQPGWKNPTAPEQT